MDKGQPPLTEILQNAKTLVSGPAAPARAFLLRRAAPRIVFSFVRSKIPRFLFFFLPFPFSLRALKEPLGTSPTTRRASRAQ